MGTIVRQPPQGTSESGGLVKGPEEALRWDGWFLIRVPAWMPYHHVEHSEGHATVSLSLPSYMVGADLVSLTSSVCSPLR